MKILATALECADTQAADQLLETLPLVQAGLIRFDVIPLVPYPGFGRLFKGQGWQQEHFLQSTIFDLTDKVRIVK